MISPTRIAKLLLDRVAANEATHRRRPRANLREEEIVGSLLEVIDDVCKCTSYEIESDTTLDHDYDDFGDVEDENDDSDNEDVDPIFDETVEGKKMPIKPVFSLDYMKKFIDYYDARDSNGKRKHTWKSTQHRFKSVPHRQYIARFRHYIEQNGTKREKTQGIDDFDYDKFEEARDSVLPVHDRDLKRWGIQKAAEDPDLMFEASEHWLRVFKQRHRICSRKITKLVTRHHTDYADTIVASADTFLADVKRQMKKYAPEEILNTDQVAWS